MNTKEGKIIDLQSFRQKKQIKGDRKIGLQDAFKPVSVAPAEPAKKDDDIAVRIERIKTSIQRINQLMADLRGTSNPNTSKH